MGCVVLLCVCYTWGYINLTSYIEQILACRVSKISKNETKHFDWKNNTHIGR